MFQCEFIDLQNERKVLCSLKTQVLITKCKQYFLNYQPDFFFFFFFPTTHIQAKKPQPYKRWASKEKERFDNFGSSFGPASFGEYELLKLSGVRKAKTIPPAPCPRNVFTIEKSQIWHP